MLQSPTTDAAQFAEFLRAQLASACSAATGRSQSAERKQNEAIRAASHNNRNLLLAQSYLSSELLADLQRVQRHMSGEKLCGFYYGRASYNEIGFLLKLDGTCVHRHATDSHTGFCSPVVTGHWQLEDGQILFDFGDIRSSVLNWEQRCSIEGPFEVQVEAPCKIYVRELGITMTRRYEPLPVPVPIV